LLFGSGVADTWTALPPLSAALMLGAALWFAARAGARRTSSAVSAPGWFVVLACVAACAYVALGWLGARLTGGAFGQLVGTTSARGLLTAASTGAWGLAAHALSTEAGRPLFGRRLALTGLTLWAGGGFASAALPLAPDLLPRWLVATAAVGVAAQALGAVVLLVVVLPPSTFGGRATWFAAGCAAMALSAVAEAASLPALFGSMRFTAWSPWAGLFPPLAGLTLVAIGAALPPGLDGSRLERRALLLAGSAVVFSVAPLLPIGIVEALAGPTSRSLRAEAALRLPGASLAVAASLTAALLAWVGLLLILG
jgi:hypothetical protein